MVVASKHNLIEILIKLTSKINITNLGSPDLTTRNVKVFEPPVPEVTVGKTSGAGVSSLANDDQMMMEEKEWSELFGNRRDFTSFDRLSKDETEEIEAEGNSKIPD